MAPQQMVAPQQQFVPMNDAPLKRKEGIFFIDESGNFQVERFLLRVTRYLENCC